MCSASSIQPPQLLVPPRPDFSLLSCLVAPVPHREPCLCAAKDDLPELREALKEAQAVDERSSSGLERLAREPVVRARVDRERMLLLLLLVVLVVVVGRGCRLGGAVDVGEAEVDDVGEEGEEGLELVGGNLQ